MLIAEPGQTPYDLHFSIFGFPVRIHPFFWLVALIFGIDGDGTFDGTEIVIWIAVMFLSILVHELGHAFAFRRFGIESSVVLYALGGVAVPDGGGSRNVWKSYKPTTHLSPQQQILVSLAGPAAGFGLAAITILVMLAAGGNIHVFYGTLGIPLVFASHATASALSGAVNSLLWLNIIWGLVNLLPIYPLDGGQVARQLFLLYDHRDGFVRSVKLSLFVAVAVAVFGALVMRDMWMTMMFASLAYSSYQILQQLGGYRGPW
ncbi:peptidase M50 [Pirellula staleyi DSM 6068]|uniref:Peptidase M50 n=1 Tax=Pirellula staleyi (strain ATCC 27377 / DSM 6068 / ICPB 4128) TaxID=530564 RepID=D2R5F1_PIRSD|nr:site-2 protease family protein [Pirellula staleyi]ADB15410.1 peptidase M50 [Pirellula staleyi DSM 6068]